MNVRHRGGWSVAALVAVVVAVALLGACAPSAPKGAKPGKAGGGGATSDMSVAAGKVYVAPGDLDEYYMFSSGGHSGQVYVYGLPSMRHISTIPVYSPYPATGYGFDDDSKAMLGYLTWGDVHHPSLSETGGDYDGRWLFVNDMNGRVARVDLRDFKTKQILGPVPNVSGNHGSAFVTPNTEYSMMASRFSIPLPKGTTTGTDKYATDYKGVLTAIKIDPKKVPGLVWLMPCGKSPHGVDVSPDGKWIIGSGKLQGVTTAFNFEKVQTAIRNKDYEGDEDGIPVLKYESIKDAEVPVGLGPLHTQFGPNGMAYTSLFVDSAIASWKLGTWELVDKVPMSYSIGHLAAAEGDTVNPDGKYLVGLNKLSHGRHLSVGPSQPESSQLVDISDEKMKLLSDTFTEPEPHYAQIIKADKIHTIEVYPKEDNHHPLAIWDVKDAGIARQGGKAVVKMIAVRTSFTPTEFTVNQGETVTVAVTNIEQTTDELHGFAILDYNINIVIDPGETKTVTFKAEKKGVFPFYCTNFCSALHQEMQGYMIVK